jgi:hypothetical protein
VDLPFNEGDRVSMDDRSGRVVTVNHDDPDRIIFLVAFDTPLHDKDGDDDIDVRTAWIESGYLTLDQPAAEWADARIAELAAAPPTNAVADELAKVLRLKARWTGVDPAAEAQAAARIATLLRGVPIDGPGHD